MGWVLKDDSETGIWSNYKNEETGEETIKLHTPKVVWESCKQGQHSYQITGNREMKCSKCNFVVSFVPGRDNDFLKSNGVK